MQTHQFHIVKINNVVLKYLGREALHEKYDIEDNFMKHMRTIYKKFCKPEYLEYEFDFIDLNTLEERLKNRMRMYFMVSFLAGVEVVLFQSIMMRMVICYMYYIVWNVLMNKRKGKISFYIWHKPIL